MYKYAWSLFFCYISHALIVYSISSVDEAYFKKWKVRGKKIPIQLLEGAIISLTARTHNEKKML